ncbi:sodium channel protein Nach-like [Lasioglossum baleicum]|uniref:sodium channel protein Nach-like n=1 Tax=Lasioglossum baleicum TaxID=434251 RepID=UPI003FCC55FD
MPTARPQHRGKLAVSYGWASPVTRKRSAQSSRFQTLIKYFNLYCKHSSMMGLKYLVEDRATWTVRLLWLIAYLMIVWLMWIYVPLICRDSLDTFITVTAKSGGIPTESIEYPGIAICNVNRISLRKATMLATDMYNANISNMTVDEILDAIKDLGYLYNTHFRMTKSYSEIDRLLLMYYGDYYNITEIMLYLTPECSRLLIACALHNKRRNCSDMFSVEITQDGFCCTFNYFPGGDDNVTYEVAEDVGFIEGLIVMMDPMLDDYFFTMMPVTGIKAMIFDPREYPDTITGGVTELLISPQRKQFVRLRALALSSSKLMQKFSVYRRGCIFAHEKGLTHKAYSFGNCIVACTVKDLWKYCKCTPFFYPDFFVKLYNRTCTVEDLPCLIRYLDAKRGIVPFDTVELEDLIEGNSTINCEICYPSCNDVTYLARCTTRRTSKEPMYVGINVTAYANYSILSIYFDNQRTLSLRQDVSYRWFQFLSDVGGICELFLGCSIISFVELVYFIILCLTELLTSDSDPEANEEVENQQVQPPMQLIYWNELCPRSRFTKPLKRIRKSSKNS